jgi:glutamate racemase
MALHLVVTDSGVGGLSACAAIERALRLSAHEDGEPARITYVNVWPSEHGGYNDMADMRAEAEVFDRALNAMAALGPDQIVIACNTLSIVYEHTDFRRSRLRADASTSGRRTADSGLPTPDSGLPSVLGIVDAGVDLFYEALTANPESVIALFGTKTTIESGVHRERLIAKGIAPHWIIPVGCHGLAKSIETEMDGPSTLALIDECTERASHVVGRGFPGLSELTRVEGSRAEVGATGPLFLGVCCTHYTYLRDEMGTALQRHLGQAVEVLDPTDRLVAQVMSENNSAREVEDLRPNTAPGGVSGGRELPPGVVSPAVTVISKVRMPEEKRRLIAARLRAVSPATADALLDYRHVPDLF